MNETRLIAKRRLNDEEFAQIKCLEETCNREEGISVKFNWGMMRERRADYRSDFCCYCDGQLVGYAPLDHFGGSYEVTAAVLPAYRRRGVLRLLWEAARREAERCHATELLLVCYPASPSGMAAVRRLDITYRSSEYHMKAQSAEMPPLPASALQLEDVTAANVAELSRLLASSFDNARWNTPEALLQELRREDNRYFLALLEEEIIGQIGVIVEDRSAYIRAVGIVPERRGQGYGRQLLSALVQKLLAEGCTEFGLDVATDNRQALSLYQSCGFREITVYDYYTVPLPTP